MRTWLEISSASNEATAITIESRTLQKIGPLADALRVAENASSGGSTGAIWDYAKRLELEEFRELLAHLRFRKIQDDVRSIVYQAIISYKNSSYVLNLFVDKGQ
jgi:hypothetical protein